MTQHVKVIGALCIVFGVVYVALAMFGSVALAFLANLVGTSSDPDAAVGEVVLGFTGVVLAMIFGLFALLYLITGWGLLKFRPWGRTLGIVVAAISLLKFPIGTAFGIYALVILFRKETEALFAKQSDRPAGA